MSEGIEQEHLNPLELELLLFCWTKKLSILSELAKVEHGSRYTRSAREELKYWKTVVTSLKKDETARVAFEPFLREKKEGALKERWRKIHEFQQKKNYDVQESLLP